MSDAWTRRDFAKTSAAMLAAGVWGSHSVALGQSSSPNEKLNLAFVGIGGQGALNLKGCKSQNIVALCDVDDERAGKAYQQHPKAKKFFDFRQMFDEMEQSIDGVVVSTPDHGHYHPAKWTLDRKKHLYLEKPLCHSVWETRRITDFAREQGVATQLGVQRHAEGLRESVELIKAGVIGTVKSVHSWLASDRGMPEIPSGQESPPAHLKWDLWLGPAADRPYHAAYVPYNWRFWWDFGTGDTGNWGCHILDIPFWSLGLKYPTKVELLPGGEWHERTTPKALATKFDFPTTAGVDGQVELFWQQGVPKVITDLGETKGYNNFFIGTEGMLLSGFDRWRLLPDEKFKGVKPAKTIPDSPGFHQEWFNACRGGDPATCNFEYGGPLAETALLGNVAFRARSGFDWDAANLKATGAADAEKYLTSHFRQGWEPG